jgi:hypothetical protein
LLRAFDQCMCDRLTGVIAPHVPADQLEGVVETIVVFIEGLLGRRLPEAERDRRLVTALHTLLPDTCWPVTPNLHTEMRKVFRA